ncbi:MAG: homoserine O-succinyltransferase [Lachnospiraceae bacterium]|nr:homoserine O-succinyltransferase [Lachnospiraceae bacterium]
MPILVQNDLPAKQILESENIFVMDERRAHTQQIRPLKVCILNLMPLKEATELDLLRVLSNFPIQVQVTFLKVESYESTHTTPSHLNRFYTVFSEICDDYFDGMIITGAPVEQMPFEQVDYWEELTKIMTWTRTHVFSTLHICWASQAGLYYHHGINKVLLPKKLSGVYPHRVLHRKKMLMRGMDDYFWAPQSRYTGLDEAAVAANPELYVVAAGEETGSCIILAYASRQIFVTGHTEYDRMELDQEYRRDVSRGLNPDIPVNYYPDDDPSKEPVLSWRSSSNCIYTNWLHLVYQGTPYDLSELTPIEEDSYTVHHEKVFPEQEDC